MPDRQTMKVAGLYGAGALGVVGLVFGLLWPAASLGPLAKDVLIIVAVVWALGFAGLAWRRTDEAARQAHMFAMFWGAPFALLALILALPVVAITVFHVQPHPGAQLFTAGSDHFRLVMAGVLLAGLAQVAGYGLVWAGWWLRHR